MNIKSGFGLVALTAVISIAFYFTDYSITGNILAVLLIPGFNHAPVLDPIGNLTATEGFLFTQKITATDEDGNSIVFYENASFFDFTDVNSTSTLINFTPTSSMAGVHTVLINASDMNRSDSEEINFTIIGLFCGDIICSSSEDCSVCSLDCGTCPISSGGEPADSGR